MAITALDQFDAVVERFGKVAAYALGGSAFVPLITAASGMAPTWPDGLPFITSILMLITMVLVFHFLTTRRRRAFSILLVMASIALVMSIGGYSYARGNFVLKAPRTGTELTLGCQWRPEIVRLAKVQGIDVRDQCPGDFRELLAKAEDDPFQIWTERSISNVAFIIAGLWVTLFVTLALVLGAFVIFYTRHPKAPGTRATPKSDAAA